MVGIKKDFFSKIVGGKDWGKYGTAILPYSYEIDSAWAISTQDNNIYTYQTIWQKIYNLIVKILKFIKEK